MRSSVLSLALVVALLPVVNVEAASPDSGHKAQEIAELLKQSGQLQDYRVGVKYEDGVAWLTGTVTSEQQWQTAQQLVRQTPGVFHVVNRLEVQSPPQHQIGAVRQPEEMAAPNGLRACSQPVPPAPQPTPELRIPSASSASSTAERVQQTSAVADNQQAPRAQPPRSNMPVPYARTAHPRAGVHPAAYSQQAQYCPGGGCQPGGPAPMMGPGPAARGQAVNYDNPQLPGYAWPSYAASPNYAALTYPKQYSASAWPYIGPFYPYPQVPLGWRKVTLEWDDGWWHLDFADCKHCR